jgi:hypothetical protein
MRLFIALFVATLAFAQEKPAEPKQPEADTQNYQAEVITVKTLTGDSFDRLMKLLSVFGAKIQGDGQLRTIVVYAPKDVVAQMRHVVEQLDRPGSEASIGKNIDMTMTLLRCSPKAPASPEPLPVDLESVARQLRSTTQYKDIQLWDSLPLHLQEGTTTQETVKLPGPVANGTFSTTTIEIHPDAVYRKDQARYVRFSRVRLDFRIPVVTGTFQNQNQYQYNSVSLHTSGDFAESQKTVLGKVSGTGDEDAIFAVITFKILD